MNRIAIVGGPRVGKTTLSEELGMKLGVDPLHTDDLIDTHAWSDASTAVAAWFDRPGPWVIEGVAVVRALRKWLEAHPEGLPVDALYFSATPRVQLTVQQAVMSRGHNTVWLAVRGELARRGLPITTF